MKTTTSTIELSKLVQIKYVAIPASKLCYRKVIINDTVVLAEFARAKAPKYELREQEQQTIARLRCRLNYFRKSHEVDDTNAHTAFIKQVEQKPEPAVLTLEG